MSAFSAYYGGVMVGLAYLLPYFLDQAVGQLCIKWRLFFKPHDTHGSGDGGCIVKMSWPLF